MIDISEVSWLAIVVSAVFGMGLGGLWYSPVLFGNAWMRAVGKTHDELGSPGPAVAVSMFCCVVTAIALELLVTAVGLNTWISGLSVGLLIGLGVVAMTMLSDSIFSGWGWPLYFIQTSYRVIIIVVMGVICGAL